MISRRTAALRHAQCFANILLSADQLYQGGGSHMENGLRLFDLNQKNIEMGQQ